MGNACCTGKAPSEQTYGANVSSSTRPPVSSESLGSSIFVGGAYNPEVWATPVATPSKPLAKAAADPIRDDLDIKKLESVTFLGRLVHTLQRERGLTAMYVGTAEALIKADGKGSGSARGLSLDVAPVRHILRDRAEKLERGRAKTEEAWEVAVKGWEEVPQDMRGSQSLDDLEYSLIKDLHEDIEGHMHILTSYDTTKVFNRVIANIITFIATSSFGAMLGGLGAPVSAHVAFLNVKECLGITRAFVAGGLASGEFAVPAFAYLNRNDGAQVKQRLCDGEGAAAVSLSADRWYELMSARIDVLESIQEALATDIRKQMVKMREGYQQEKKSSLAARRAHMRSSFTMGHNATPPTTSVEVPKNMQILPPITVEQEQESENSRGGLLGGAITPRALTTVKSEDIAFGKEIGAGSTGKTFLGTWRGTKVAIKVVDVETASSNDGNGKLAMAQALKEFEVESEILSCMRHPNVCLYLGGMVEPPKYCLVLEYMSGGTVWDLLQKDSSRVDFFRAAIGTARGMQYVHDHCMMMHRDLKSPNLLCDDAGNVKIADFGLGCLQDAESKSGVKTGETGTYRWMAPEVILHQPYGQAADVYSFGIILWELLTAKLPFHGISPIKAAMSVAVYQARPTLPAATPPAVANLINDCWLPDPETRPTFVEIVDRLEAIEGENAKDVRKAVLKIRTSPHPEPAASTLGHALAPDSWNIKSPERKGSPTRVASPHAANNEGKSGGGGVAAHPLNDCDARKLIVSEGG